MTMPNNLKEEPLRKRPHGEILMDAANKHEANHGWGEEKESTKKRAKAEEQDTAKMAVDQDPRSTLGKKEVSPACYSSVLLSLGFQMMKSSYQ